MDPVERLSGEFRDLLAILQGLGEISLINAVEDNFRRNLLLAAASFFEARLVDHVLKYARDKSTDDLLIELVRIKAVERQYHTWFDWKQKNANQFFSLFGQRFKAFMKERLDQDDSLRLGVTKFMEIGSDRNRLVHENFASFVLEKTGEEIFAAYQQALVFVERLPALLDECARAGGPRL